MGSNGEMGQLGCKDMALLSGGVLCDTHKNSYKTTCYFFHFFGIQFFCKYEDFIHVRSITSLVYFWIHKFVLYLSVSLLAYPI